MNDYSRGVLSEKLPVDDASYVAKNEHIYHALIFGVKGEAAYAVDDAGKEVDDDNGVDECTVQDAGGVLEDNEKGYGYVGQHIRAKHCRGKTEIKLTWVLYRSLRKRQNNVKIGKSGRRQKGWK